MGPVVTSIIPEIILLGVAVALYVVAGYRRCAGSGRTSAVVAIVGCVAALAGSGLVLSQPGAIRLAATAALTADPLADFAKFLFPTIGIGFILLSMPRTRAAAAPEYYGTLLVSLAGMMLVGAANDLVTLFLGLELVSIPTYILIYLMRPGNPSREAATKYFFLGVFASGLFLYGLSLLYGLTGATGFVPIAAGLGDLAGAVPRTVMVLALVMVVAGLCYKIGAVPLHFYVPDVYQGAPTPVTALLAFGPKAAGFLALIRLVTITMGSAGEMSVALLWILAAATMTVGNVLAMLQPNVKRMLAYSSIAHAGYMLMGLVAGYRGEEGFMAINGVAAVLVYLVVYAAMNLGAFAVLTALERKGEPADELDDVAGLHRRSPGMAAMMAVFMFSLMGIPLTAGFIGKLCLFSSILAADPAQVTANYWLAVIGAVNAAIASFYYLRVCARMYLHDPIGEDVTVSQSPPIHLTVTACALVTLVLGIFPGPAIDVAKHAAGPYETTPVLRTVQEQPGPEAPSPAVEPAPAP